MKIAAVVVTFNRLQLLKKVIESLKLQSVKLDSIIVINNGSSDGTKEWLDAQTGLRVVHQENIGGSGGFYTGLKVAYELGFDWFWCMDDDVFPTSDCLKNLLLRDTKDCGILCPSEYQNNSLYITEKKKISMTNPFAAPIILTREEICSAEAVEIEGMTFEGPLIKRDVVEKIGLPNKDFFILYDDTEYSYRAFKSGFKVLYVPSAVLVKKFFPIPSNVERVSKGKWKVWYFIRNGTYFYKIYGQNFFVRYFAMLNTIFNTLGSICVNYPRNKKYKLGDLLIVLNMYIRGIMGRLGKM